MQMYCGPGMEDLVGSALWQHSMAGLPNAAAILLVARILPALSSIYEAQVII